MLNFRIGSLLLVTLMLWGCGEEQRARERVELALKSVTLQMDELAGALSADQIRNALILKQYASLLSTQRPELRQLAATIAEDATTSGPLYRSLQTRLKTVSETREGSLSYAEFPQWQDRLQELDSLHRASSVQMFNDALSDPVNVLSDLSGGNLARVNAISAAAEQMAGERDQTAGQQLVGNPGYGQWSGSGASSFWVWYGQYAMMSRLLGGRTYYGDWGRSRRYSYYHDVGRNNYTSPRQKYTQATREQTTKKQFRNSGKRFTSPYSRTRAGASGLSRASTSQSKAVFTSPYSKKSSSGSSYRSSYQSSARNSSARTLRGVSRGK